MQLPDNYTLGRWLFEKYDIWQLRLLDEQEIERYASDRGLMPLFIEKYVRKLWQMGLLNADLVESSEIIELDGLIYLGSNSDQTLYYADERQILPSPTGSAVPPTVFSSQVRLLFHPFRYYVLYNIDRILRSSLSPIQILESSTGYPRFIQHEVEFFNAFPANPEFIAQIALWNRVSALAIAVEPYLYPQLFGTLRRPAGRSFELQEQIISSHWDEVKQCYRSVGLKILETYHGTLCFDAEMLDPNKDVHTLLRLTEGDKRIKYIKGQLGGSMLLLTMAEMVRRGTEKAFDVQLREEDEVGSAPFVSGVKKEIYGSTRIFDGQASVRTRWLQSFGLDSGVRLRWYVEGDTEYYALESLFGSYIAIDLINLRGQVVARLGKGVGFRDNLRSDVKSMIFSFVSIDGDRSDYLRAIRKAAEDDEICGMFFVSEPDFECQNFTLDELEEILWQMAQDQCLADDFDRGRLHNAIQAATNAKELLEAARSASPCLQHIGKGAEWGKRLIGYALEHPEMPKSSSSGQQRRQVVEAINHALHTVHLDYQPSRDATKVNPITGLPVKRDAPAD